MLHSATIKNFKSIRNVSVDLKPLTIIIGPNASGKSNFLDGLEAVKHIVRYKGTTRPGREGDLPTLLLDDVLWRKAKPDEKIYWELNVGLTSRGYSSRQLRLFDDEVGREDIVYNLVIKNDAVDEVELPVIDLEKLTKLPENFIILSRQMESITMQEGQVPLFPLEISSTDLALHFFARESLPAVKNLRYYIQQWQFHKIIPEMIRSQLFSVRGKNATLRKDGSNLANVLYYLQEDHPEDFDYIQEEMQKSLNFAKIHTVEDDEVSEVFSKRGLVFLEAQENVFADEKPFGPNNLSDGTLGFLALLTILSVSDPAPLICLEEPERSIHLHLIPRLAHLLHEAAYHTQLLITTHSPELLDYFDPYEQDHVQVLVAYRNIDGATEFVPVRNVQNVQKWLDDYMLGQIWSMGQIEEMLEVG